MSQEDLNDWHEIYSPAVTMVKEDDDSVRKTVGWWPQISWCVENWGNEGTDPRVGYRGKTWIYAGPGRFRFMNEEDAVLFWWKWS